MSLDGADRRDEAMVAETRRSIRLLSILRCAHNTGFEPVPGTAIHTIAYLADALSPVWGLPLLDAHVLKNRTRPNFPALQRDLDVLVGRGVVEVHDLTTSPKADSESPIGASFSLTLLAAPSLGLILASEYFRRQFNFVREVTFAAAALGPEGLASIGTVDASYADPFADVGSVIELGQASTSGRTTAEVAEKFRVLAPDADLTDAQLVHLYMRHLYSRLRVA